jgi:TnpA family transposase
MPNAISNSLSLNVNFPFDYLPDNLASNCWFAHSKFNRGLKLYRPPSAFLARINSYRTQNQFARALQELGRAVRTKFLLRWIWDEPMRRTVHKCTTRIERYHRFAAQIYKLLG